MLLFSRRPWLEVCGGELWPARNFGGRRRKWSRKSERDLLSWKKGNRQRAVASHPAVPGVDFRKQVFVLSIFLKDFHLSCSLIFLFVACCVCDPYVRIPSLAVKVVMWTVEHSADAWSCLCCENVFFNYQSSLVNEALLLCYSVHNCVFMKSWWSKHSLHLKMESCLVLNWDMFQ